MKKSLIIPLLILVILLVVYILVSDSEKKNIQATITGNFLAIDSGSVDKFEISKLGMRVNFHLQNNSWYVVDNDKDYLAANEVVNQILQVAYNLQVNEIVSSNPNKQMLFQVDTLMGTRLSFYNNDKYLAGLIVGKAGVDNRNSYVRKSESDDVYQAVGALSYLFNRPTSEFRDKTLLKIDTTQINIIELNGLEVNYSFLNQDSLWKVIPVEGESFVADGNIMSAVLRSLANMRFNEFLENPESLNLDFNKSDLAMLIALRDGTERKLQFIVEGGESENYFVKSSLSNEPYRIFKYVVEGITPSLEKLKK